MSSLSMTKKRKKKFKEEVLPFPVMPVVNVSAETSVESIRDPVLGAIESLSLIRPEEGLTLILF